MGVKKSRNKQRGWKCLARKKDENREKAKQIFIESNGLAKNGDIAEALGVDSAKIRKWKCIDKWKETLEKRPKKRGAQKGNKNAAGHGAPLGNKNAETHGAYSMVYLDSLPPEERAYIETLTLDTTENMLMELRVLKAKERDLQKRINYYTAEGAGKLYIDKVMEMRTPGGGRKEDGDSRYQGSSIKPALSIAMETTVKSSAFERVKILEAELSKIQGRIIKLLDSIKSYETEQHRIQIEEKRYALMKQKAMGVYDVEPGTGDIEDIMGDYADIIEE